MRLGRSARRFPVTQYQYYEEEEVGRIRLSEEETDFIASFLNLLYQNNIKLAVYHTSSLNSFQCLASLFEKLSEKVLPESLVPERTIIFYNVAGTNIPKVEDIIANTIGGEEEAEGMDVLVTVFSADFIPLTDPIPMRSLSDIALASLRYDYMRAVFFTRSPLALYDNVVSLRMAVMLEDLMPYLVCKHHPHLCKYSYSLSLCEAKNMRSEAEALKYIRERRYPTPVQVEKYEPVLDLEWDEYVLPESLKEFIETNIIVPLKKKPTAIPSLLFLGVAGSGKKTLAYLLGKILSMPVYKVEVNLVSSKWVGETEKNLFNIFNTLNDLSPCIAILPEIEGLIAEKKTVSAGEEKEKVKNIIAYWLKSKKKRFIPVLTVSNPRLLPEAVVEDPSFGAYKLIIPPPISLSHRVRILKVFLRKLSKEYGVGFKSNGLVDKAVEEVARETEGYTVRDLYEISRKAYNFALKRGHRVLQRNDLVDARSFHELSLADRMRLLVKAIEISKKTGLPRTLLEDLERLKYRFQQVLAKAYRLEKRREEELKIV